MKEDNDFENIFNYNFLLNLSLKYPHNNVPKSISKNNFNIFQTGLICSLSLLRYIKIPRLKNKILNIRSEKEISGG